MTGIKRFSTAVICVAMLFVCVGMTAEVHAAAVKLSRKSVTLDIDKSAALKVSGTKKAVRWSSSNKKIVVVSKKGKITAKKAGTATVYAKVAKKTLKCKVSVRALTKYWSKDSVSAKRLRSYVAKVTNKANGEFIPKNDRIAVFDMDGTLTCETYFTYYDTMMFIEYCLKDHPDKVSEDLKEAAAAIKPGYKADLTLAQNFARAYAGMTIDEYYDYAVEFGKRNTASFTNMRYIDGFYLPMVELVEYLYDNGFTVYVVSGTERTVTRAIVANSPIKDYVTPDHVIGTEFEVKQKGHETEQYNTDYKYADGDELVITGGFIQKNLNSNKCIFIEREVGKRPVLAFGNSGSDTSMMNYAIDKRNKYASEAFMLVNDDKVREWGPEDWASQSEKWAGMGYTPVSMAQDFGKIYPAGIVPSDSQYQEIAG